MTIWAYLVDRPNIWLGRQRGRKRDIMSHVPAIVTTSMLLVLNIGEKTAYMSLVSFHTMKWNKRL
ncbi:hypothetical protein CC80DRAFT_237585 [Byssothecium circinans]|uniref:Uncharacterized protein n=1 Tax=Byssothecium circinans TaxID=147558 RepID=A0A6A5UAU1_9PLEO|nr:hypothetical protein CC80DRAFT_237585 [Byssothecium circinans]